MQRGGGGYKGHVRWIRVKKTYDGAHTGGTDDEGHVHEGRDTKEISEGRGKRRGTTNEGDEGHVRERQSEGYKGGDAYKGGDTHRDTHEGHKGHRARTRDKCEEDARGTPRETGDRQVTDRRWRM